MSNNIFHVVTSYSFSIDTEVELPEGKTIADIEDIYVKWSTVKIAFKDQTEFERPESDFDLDYVDWKRPSDTEFYAGSEEGECYFETPLQIPEEGEKP